jgi:hypothetical protein
MPSARFVLAPPEEQISAMNARPLCPALPPPPLN